MDSVLKKKGEVEAFHLFTVWICRFCAVTKRGPLTFKMPLLIDVLRGQRPIQRTFVGPVEDPALIRILRRVELTFYSVIQGVTVGLRRKKMEEAGGPVPSAPHHFLCA